MKIQEKLLNLIEYYNTTRGVGHTELMIASPIGESCIIMSHNERMGKYIKEKIQSVTLNHENATKNIKFISTSSNLRGMKLPLLIDNAALHTIFLESLSEIETLRQEITKLKTKFNKIEYIINEE